MAVFNLVLRNWHPARLNELTSGHWGVRQRLKERDRHAVAMNSLLQGVPPAKGRRRVSLVITLKKGQRAADPDAYWKSSLDALVQAGLLKDDSPRWLELGTVAYQRTKSARFGTTIILEDVKPAPKIPVVEQDGRTHPTPIPLDERHSRSSAAGT